MTLASLIPPPDLPRFPSLFWGEMKVRTLKMDATRLAQVGESLESESQDPENGRSKDSTGREKLVFLMGPGPMGPMGPMIRRGP